MNMDIKDFEEYEDSNPDEILEMFDTDNDEKMYDEILEKYGLDIKKLEQEMINTTPKLKLVYHKLDESAVDPVYNYELDSGFDFYSTEEVTIPAFGRALIPTGLSFDLPDGHEMQVRSKSGLAIKQGLMVLNSPGTVDKGYLGEIKVILFNVNNHEFVVKKGMKVAQGVVCPVVAGKWLNLINEKINVSDSPRQDKGFGSTGI
jgi:dUTP pyrophosphatase